MVSVVWAVWFLSGLLPALWLLHCETDVDLTLFFASAWLSAFLGPLVPAWLLYEEWAVNRTPKPTILIKQRKRK